MTTVDELVLRNRDFVRTGFDAGLTINPSGKMMVIGCVDPRVDPTRILGIEHGEAAVIRNVGGRITPSTLKTLAMLRRVGAANSDGIPRGDWNLVILHHTDCGMTDLAAYPDLLADYFEIPEAELESKSVSDPVGSVRVDVELINRSLRGPAFLVSGLVYDVASGSVETVVPATQLPNL